MTFGFDLSRYDDAGGDTADAVGDPWAEFVILNLEDPNCGRKVSRAQSLGKPWALYSWLYPGAGASSVDAVARAIDRHGTPPKGAFLDYEQNGVTARDSADARARRDALAMSDLGFYTYLYLLNSQPGLADEWAAWDGRWIAYYPGDNGGAYPGDQIGSAQYMAAMLWQFTSSGGSRDRNVVVDEAAWSAWGTGTAPAPPTTTIGDDDVTYLETRADGSKAYWKLGLGDYFEIPEAVALGEELNGHGKAVPINTGQRIEMGNAAKAQADHYLAGHPTPPLSDAQLDALADKVAAKIPAGQGTSLPFHFTGTASQT